MYLRYAVRLNNDSESKTFYVLSLMYYLCALFSKTVTASLPAALLLVLWWKRGRVGWPELRDFAPFFLLGIGLGLVTVATEKYKVGTAGEEWSLSLIERCLIAGRALWFYAGKLFWPYQLSFNYPRWEIDTGAWDQYLYPLLAIAVVSVLWTVRNRLGRGPLVAVLFFAGTLAPALGFFNVYPQRYSFVADHFQYLAGLGLIALVVSASHLSMDGLGRGGKGIAAFGVVLILVTLGTLTWNQSHIYQDNETLYKDTLQKNPNSRLALNNLGTILADKGELSEALRYFRRALQNWPNDYKAHRNLAHTLAKQGKLDEAAEHYRRAISIRPDYADAHNGIGYVLILQGKLDQAIEHYGRHLTRWPLDADAHNNLANILMRQGKFNEALGHYREALRIDPRSATTHNNLGWSLVKIGSLNEALKYFRQAIDLDANYPPALTGTALILATHPDSNIRDGNRAVQLVERALRLTGSPNLLIVETLAVAYAAVGRFDDAVKAAQAGLNLASNVRDDELSNVFRKQLELYRNGQSYRGSLPEPHAQ